MAVDKKISELPSGAPAIAGDEYIVARSGANYKLTLTNIAASMPPIGATTPNTGAFTTLSASGAASFADGSVSAPAVTNTGDTDTGVYFPAANEVAVTTGGTVAAGFNSNGLFFRNRIINGDMRIDQRNAGAAFTSGGNLYCIDRWLLQAVGATNTAQQTNGTGNNKAVIITGNTSNTLTGFSQRIESWNISDLAGQIVTVSFTLSGSASGSVSVRRLYPTATDNYSSTTEPSAGISVNFTTSPTRYSVAFTLASDANKGLWLYFDFGGVGAGVTRTIENVQLESGSVATPFERRPFGTELMLCQRYCYVQDGSTGAFAFHGQGLDYSTTTGSVTVVPPVSMRSSPTFSSNIGTGSFAVQQSTGSMEAVTALTSAYSGPLFCYVDYSTAGNLGAGNSNRLLRNAGNTATKITLSAEL